MQTYSFGQTLDLLDGLETKEAVELFRFWGIDLWPLFRMQLLFRRSDVKPEVGDPNHLSAGTRLKLKLMKRAEKVRITGPGGVDAPRGKIWTLYDETYYDEIPGRRRYHKFLDPIVEKDPERFLRISTRGSSEAPDFTGTPKWKVNHNAHMDYFWMVERLRTTHALEARVGSFFDEKIAEPVPLRRFLRSAAHVIYYAERYAALIDRYRPTAILLVCYYEEQKFGLIHAARKAGLPVVDIQHGSQGLNHIMYRHWGTGPADGYSILPSDFWCWSPYWAEQLEKSLGSLERKPSVSCAGHFWFDKLSEISLTGDYYTKITVPEGRPCALFAVQPANFDDTVGFLRGAMDADPSRFWMVRLHPRMVADMRLFLEALEGYENQYDIVDATRMPLTVAFNLIDVVVSLWSTVLLDGLYYGIPGIVVHPNGRITFNDIIEAGHLGYATTPGEFTKLAQDLTSQDTPVAEGFKSPHHNPIELIDKLLASNPSGV